MNLEDIGFYTLSDKRAASASIKSPLYRCELILTDRCNFRCTYCRGLRPDIKETISYDLAKYTLDIWIREGLRNVRFSGGEPLLYPGLLDLVKRCKQGNVERIAVSSNGSLPAYRYEELVAAGVNDWSISLDGACCSVGDKMAGGIKGAWDKVVANIRMLSKLTYITVGMVFTDENVDTCCESVMFADSLGVSDIRVIPSAQYNEALSRLAYLPDEILSKYPILRYRVKNIRSGRHVRGIAHDDFHRCPLVLDDMASAAGYHFPCIIYMREGGDPIGKVCPSMRQDRLDWFKRHDTSCDPICSKNCLDVCVDYNNRVKSLNKNLPIV